MRFSVRRRKGFTLIELIIVIALIGIMAAVLFVAINPAKRLEDAKNAKRKANIRALEEATQLYVRDMLTGPAASIPLGIGNAKPICRSGNSDPSCLNIDSLRSNGNIGAIPVDSAETNGVLSGYRIYKSPEPAIYACNDYLPLGDVQRCLPCSNAPLSSFAGGDGTGGNPYQICSCTQLQAITSGLSDSYLLTGDIDCTDSATWNAGAGFEPIGNGSYFSGTFDGGGHTISNVTINRPTSDEIGLFTRIAGTVANVAITNANIAGRYYVGGLASNISVANVHDVSLQGAVSGIYPVGGITGTLDQATLSDCSANVSVSANSVAGAIIGFSNQPASAVMRCAAHGSLSGSHYVGGLAGRIIDGTISDSYSDATVTCNGIEECGGANGRGESPATFVRTYTIGAVSGGVNSGCFSGGYSATFTDSYYDSTVCTLPSNGFGTAKTTAQMRQQATYSGWDFSTVWQIDEGVGYPTLR
jgi:prepilin-type N-terminal cleavage/methylation domain-containing protein